MKKHDKLLISCSLRPFKRAAQPPQLPLSDLQKMLIAVFSFITVAFGSHQCIILICIKIILQKFQLSSEHLIQIFCLLRIPEHIVISPKQNLPARQSHNKIQICLTLCKISPPGMISGYHYCIILCHFSLPVLLNLNHMVLPSFIKYIHRFIDCKRKMKITDCV